MLCCLDLVDRGRVRHPQRPARSAAQRREVPPGPQGAGYVVGENPDIRALAAAHAQGGARELIADELDLMDLHRTWLQLHLDPGSGQLMEALAISLDSRDLRWGLEDRAHESSHD